MQTTDENAKHLVSCYGARGALAKLNHCMAHAKLPVTRVLLGNLRRAVRALSEG